VKKWWFVSCVLCVVCVCVCVLCLCVVCVGMCVCERERFVPCVLCPVCCVCVLCVCVVCVCLCVRERVCVCVCNCVSVIVCVLVCLRFSCVCGTWIEVSAGEKMVTCVPWIMFMGAMTDSRWGDTCLCVTWWAWLMRLSDSTDDSCVCVRVHVRVRVRVCLCVCVTGVVSDTTQVYEEHDWFANRHEWHDSYVTLRTHTQTDTTLSYDWCDSCLRQL